MSRKREYPDTLTLTRTGEFHFRTVGDKHCGMAPAGSVQECRYIVEVRCDPDTLDDDFYMFEQLRVQEVFDQIKSVRSSCERLCMRMASEIEDMIASENPDLDVHWIKVTLQAAPYAASMSFKYHPR